MKRKHSDDNEQQSKKVRFSDEVSKSSDESNSSLQSYIPAITPTRTAVGIGGLWGVFSLAFGSAPFTLPMAAAIFATTTTLSLAPLVAFKACKNVYEYFAKDPLLAKLHKVTAPYKDIITEKSLSVEDLARHLQKEMGEEKKNKSSFTYFEKLAKKAKNPVPVWMYAIKSFNKMNETKNINAIADIKKKYQAKAAKLTA